MSRRSSVADLWGAIAFPNAAPFAPEALVCQCLEISPHRVSVVVPGQPAEHAGITCLGCHSVMRVSGERVTFLLKGEESTSVREIATLPPAQHHALRTPTGVLPVVRGQRSGPSRVSESPALRLMKSIMFDP